MGKEDLIIGIPSLGRWERIRDQDQMTLRFMSKEARKNTALFVPAKEKDNYQKVIDLRYPEVRVVPVPDEYYEIRFTRDFMLNWAMDHSYTYLLMMDDDLQLCHKPTPTKYVTMDGDLFDQMLEDVGRQCGPEFPLCGIADRQFSQTKVAPFNDCSRIIQFFFMHLPTILKERLTFSGFGIQFSTDYAFVLTLLSRGYKNRVLNNYTKNDSSQTTGGCSTYRTAELHSKSAVQLAKLFPGIVTPYVKDTGSWSERRVNTRVAWKKAFREGGRS